MATVYLARDLKHGRLVAIKVDRKSTRLNSSHGSNSYAVFCWQKKRSGENLLAYFTSNDALKLAYHQRIRMRTERTTKKIVRVGHVREPIGQCLSHCAFQLASD